MKVLNPFRKIVGMSKRDHHQIPNADVAHTQAQESSARVIHKHFPNVPFVHQNHVNLCGDACAAMLMMYHGKQPPYDMHLAPRHDDVWLMDRNPRGILAGANSDSLASDFLALELITYQLYPFERRWTAAAVEVVLNLFGPFMAAKDHGVSGHWVLVVGVFNETIYYHDPWRGRNMAMTVDAFQRVNDGGADSQTFGVSEVQVNTRPPELSFMNYRFERH
ncbi:Uncharacterised protein [BD1-7 clade bacterium]|uniref:Peptidase C39-like domain-containing protein n=1 Tax=BD1-7 clade bacterium TaxID=2029982 RepID=A0A5S9MR61_9GAMM|nr:Uncharacterised protein [BD1-7 clade bacterium]